MNKTLLIALIVAIAFGTAGFFGYKVYAPLPQSENKDVTAEEPSDTTTQPSETEVEETIPVTEETETTPAVNAKVVEVTYSNTGFAPITVNIAVGDSVRFTNTSSDPMWVASGPHPTHTAYSEFDQKTAVAKGGVFTFKFSKAGTWAFHNHLKSTHTGTVVVK